MAQEKIVNLAALTYYDGKIKTHIDEKDAAALKAAKEYADSLAGNYDEAGAAATKVQELANGQVKANTDAIAKLNGDASTEGSVAKAIADAKVLIDADVDAVEGKADAAQKAADDAQADVDALAEKVGTVPADQTVMGIIQNIQENAYDDTELRGLIKTNADDIDALEGRVTTVEGKVTTLIGEDTGKSVRAITLEEVAKILNDSDPSDVDTLEEITAWIKNHPESVAELNAKIQGNTDAVNALATLVGTLPEGATATTVVGYVDEKASAAEAHADELNTAMDTRMGAAETALGTVDSRIATAKGEAIADAASKDEVVLQAAKDYADSKVAGVDLTGIATNAGKISALEGRMDVAEGDIDTLQAAIAEGGSVTLAIAEAKKAGTDAQGEVDALEGVVETLSGKVTTNTNAISGHGDRLTVLESKVGEGFVAVTNAEIDALFPAN